MKIITRDDNWRSVDQLDGIDLMDGEQLIIKWPDNGLLEQVTIRTNRHDVELPDHGSSFTSVESHAFIIREYRGITVKVGLLGVFAQRTS